MGHSYLEPAVHERRPWNAGQNVGPKRPLEQFSINPLQWSGAAVGERA